MSAGFSKDLRVGVRTRGLGRYDFAVINPEGQVIAQVVDFHARGDRSPYDVTMFPVVENAHLFAAAPELFDACLEAKAMLDVVAQTTLEPKSKEILSGTIAKLQAALTKALPPASEEAGAPGSEVTE